MKGLIINGNKKLNGVVEISGSKNSALPILAGTILYGREYIINNIPDIEDVKSMLEILRYLGCTAEYNDGCCYIDTSELNTYDIPEGLSKKLRTSIIFLGPLLCRKKIAKITYPGGCDIGKRPINLHLRGLESLGVEVKEDDEFVMCTSSDVHGNDIVLEYPSVGATENLMLFAVGLEGTTKIINAAMEPEIIDLQNFLLECGYNIEGAGTNTIKISKTEGYKHNPTVKYSIMSDRIEAGTFLALAASTDSKLCIKNISKEYIHSILTIYKKAGCLIDDVEDYIYIINNDRIKSISKVITGPYPGFPTDMQAQLMASLSISDGISVIDETVFENRYKHVSELNKMGANIIIDDKIAIVNGVKKLHGECVNVRDLRGGAALIIAALSAEGVSTVYNMDHVYRGYEKLVYKLESIGADVKEINYE